VLKRFLAEAERASSLEHHNLSHVYDVDQDGEKYYLVMEYVEGQNVQQLVESSGPQPLGKVIEIALQAIDGLLHAHDKQVVHGDLKPTNLIVDAAGTLKVTDIGQARLVESPTSGSGEEATEAAAANLGGAALFRAPELLDGKHAADPQCDVYSLGNVLCFLLSGKAAKDGAEAPQLLGAATGVPSKLAELIAQMLAADPAARPALDVVQTEVAAVRGAVSSENRRTESVGIEKSAKSAALATSKAKKPPVARAVASSEEEAADVVATGLEPPAASDNPLPGLAGLSINPQPRSRPGKLPAKLVSGKASAPQGEPAAPADGIEAFPGDAKSRKSLIPVIVVAALGGGVLMLGAIALVAVIGLNWNRETPKAEVAAVVSEADKAKKQADEAAAMERDIAAAMAAIGETNPNAPAEANPELAAGGGSARSEPPPANEPATATPVATPAAPPPATDPAKPTDAAAPALSQTAEATAPAPPSEPAKPAGPAAKAEPAKPEPTKTEPAPAPDPPKAEAPKPADKKPAAASAPAAFPGLPRATTLPKLTPMMTDPPAEALATLLIGPCPPDATAQLKGGEHAMRVGGTRFVLAEGKDDESLGKWNVIMTGAQAPLTIAQFSIQNKQLAFQWTPDGARHEYAPFLGNCKLVLSAGPDQHELALREPLKGESLLVDLEKPGATVKWNLDFLPHPKKLVVEISRLGEAFPAHKFDPSTTMEGLSADTLVWTGADPENALLGIKFESWQSPKFVQVKATAQLRSGGKAEPLIKRKLQDFIKGVDSRRFALLKKQEAMEKGKAPKGQESVWKAQLEATKKELDALAATEEQTNKLQQLVEELKGKSEVHFRVYFVADDTQVDLVVTDANPAPEKKDEPKDDGKKKTK
jgi:serine/threonine-protein kinase